MIEYRENLEGVEPSMLTGFFDGWPNPPSPETHLRILQGSYAFCFALDPAANRVVGFISAHSDGVLSAYIPLLEVLPEFRGRGIGSELVKRLLVRLSDFYMVDLTCDAELQPFYEKLGMKPMSCTVRRNFDMQKGRP